MSRTGSAVERDTIDSRRSKDLPWFHSKIGDNLAPAGRRLLEEYSGIPPSEVEGHIYSVVSNPNSGIVDASSPQALICPAARSSMGDISVALHRRVLVHHPRPLPASLLPIPPHEPPVPDITQEAPGPGHMSRPGPSQAHP